MSEVNKASWDGLLQVCTVELPKMQVVLLDDSHVQHPIMESRCYFFHAEFVSSEVPCSDLI